MTAMASAPVAQLSSIDYVVMAFYFAAVLGVGWGLRRLPMLFISGYTNLDSVSRGLLEEGRELLQKPIEPNAPARKVRAMLGARPAGSRPPA
jgi:hypothetical protein